MAAASISEPFVTVEELERVVGDVRPRDEAVIRLIGDVGLKPGEIAGDRPVVEVGDVDTGKLEVRSDVARVGTGATLELTDRLSELLAELTAPAGVWADDPLIESPRGGSLSTQAIRNICDRVVGVTPSRLRLTAAADELERGDTQMAARALRLSNPVVAAADLDDIANVSSH